MNDFVFFCYTLVDDVFLYSDNHLKVQALIDIAANYGYLYRLQYGASKTKIIVSGPDINIQNYKDTKPWKISGQDIEVVDNNEHLVQIVIGYKKEEKNIDLRIKKSRNTLFGLLGPAFSCRCLLGPLDKLHIYQTCVSPVLLSGLASLGIRV